MFKIKLDELDLITAESKASYAQIKEYILKKILFKDFFNLYSTDKKKMWNRSIDYWIFS